MVLALDLLLCSLRNYCWFCLSLSSAFVFLHSCTLLNKGLFIPVEVVRNEAADKVSREAAFLPSVFLWSSYAHLTGTHDKKGVEGLVRENEEVTAKVSFLILGGLGLLNLGGIILLSLGRIILLNISLVGLGCLIGSG